MSALPVTVAAINPDYGGGRRFTAWGVEDPHAMRSLGQMLSGFDTFTVSMLYTPHALGTLTVIRRREDEGITWIRGHHAPHSEEALALVAAWMLLRNA